LYVKFDINKYSISSVLTYAGALPFIFAAILMYWDLERLPIIGDVQKMIDVYGLIIVVFLAGSYWGLSLNLHDKIRTALMLISNCLTLIAFFTFFWLISIPFQLILILLFLVLLLIDYWLYFLNLNSKDYVILRLVVSIIVIPCLYVVYSS